MGNRNASCLQTDEIDAIQGETGFSANQIVRLYHRFASLDKGDNGFLCREDFLRIPELAINPLGDRIVHAFFLEGRDCNEVNFRQFVKVLAKFRPVDKREKNNQEAINSRMNKIRFAFKMYDLDDDSKISREELLAVLHMMVGANISEDQLRCIAERTLKETDTDRDQCITDDEFFELLNIADRTIQEADQDADNMLSFDEFCKALARTDVEQKMSIRFLH